MNFDGLRTSPSLTLERYADIDHFHESERYARAESLPLALKAFCAQRARLALPSCTLSVVSTFQRIINGYNNSEQLLVVVPMDNVSSTRLNGASIGQSLILIKGKANCTVLEPEARLVAILSVSPDRLDPKWVAFGDGHAILRLPGAELSRLQMFIRGMLDLIGLKHERIADADAQSAVEEALLFAFDRAMRSAMLHDGDAAPSLLHYKSVVDGIDNLIGFNPFAATNKELAHGIGVSVRTLQTASQAVCGMPAHRYARLRRLWSVRRQLRAGTPGLTAKASALAYGFWNISQFTRAYHSSFGELPSKTLMRARFGAGARR